MAPGARRLDTDVGSAQAHIDRWIAGRISRWDHARPVGHPPGPQTGRPRRVQDAVQPGGWIDLESRRCCKYTVSATSAPSMQPTRTSATSIGRRTDKCSFRKEVIQPQLPLRLPCYDLVPVTSPTLGACFPKRVSATTSGVTDFHDLTGGVYKPRERIHRSKADLRLLATPASCRRVAACNPN